MSNRQGIVPVREATIVRACEDIEFPKMALVKQEWKTNSIEGDEIMTHVVSSVESLPLETLQSGAKIAIGVGSRGIANLPAIVEGVVHAFQERGFEPFIFPAMGSHGGATSVGQQHKLEALGVTESTVGCHIESTMETVEVGRTPERDIPVVFDKIAAAADAIVPINRIKPHTDFQGKVESGLSKMLVIGMGKQRGAKIAHQWSVDWSLRDMLPEISKMLIDSLPVIGGIALVENQYHDTMIIEGVPADNFLQREAELLVQAYEVMPKIPFDELDLLIVDRMGKDISGSGMDTNVIGRLVYGFDEPEPEYPEIKRIYLRNLTSVSQGNASGVGSADIIHQRVLERMDLSKTLINTITASSLAGARVPAAVESDRAAVTACLSTVGLIDSKDVRVVRITDTMHLEKMLVSEGLLNDVATANNLTQLGGLAPFEFDAHGDFKRDTPDKS
jgi:hypothetical protein